LVAWAGGDQINLGSKYQSEWLLLVGLVLSYKYIQYLHQHCDN
jgi:hypothetical protein